MAAAWTLWAGWITIFAVGGLVVIAKICQGRSSEAKPFCCSLLPRRWDTMLYSLDTKQLLENNKSLDMFMNNYYLVDQLRLSYQFIVKQDASTSTSPNVAEGAGKQGETGTWECTFCAVPNPLTNLTCLECRQVLIRSFLFHLSI